MKIRTFLNANLKETPFYRILFFFLLLLVLILSTVIISFHLGFSKIYSDKVKQENLLNLKEIQATVDTEIKQILSIPMLYFSNNNLYTYPARVLENDFEKYPLQLYIVGGAINAIADFYPAVDEIDLYSTHSNIFFLNGHILFPEDMRKPDRIPNWYNYFMTTHKKPRWYVEDDSVYYISPLPLYGGDFDGVVAVKLRKSYITQNFTWQNMSSKYYGIFDSNTNTPFFTTNPVLEDSEYFQALLEEVESRETSQAFSFTYNDSLVCTVKSEYNDWYYVSIEPLSSVRRSLNTVTLFTIIITIIFTILGILVTFVLAKISYKPLQKVVENNYTLIKHNLITKILKQDISFDTLHDDEYQLSGITKGASYGFCFSIALHLEESFTPREILELHFGIITALEHDTAIECHAVFDDTKTVIQGFILYREKTDFYHLMTVIKNQLYSLVESDFSLCIGTEVDLSLEHIHSSHKHEIITRDYFYLFPKKQVITYKNLKISERLATGEFKHHMIRLEQQIKSLDMKGAESLITETVETFTSHLYSIDFCKNTLRDMVARTVNTVQSLGLHPQELFHGDIRNQFREQKTIYQFSEWMIEILREVMHHIKSQRSAYKPELKLKISTYIQNNISNQISQDLVASAFNMRVDTFSKTFKMIFGENYTTYIRKAKIQEAQLHLKTNDLSVSQLAEYLGYGNAQYFIKVFKSEVGITPHQYRLQSRI